MAELVKVLNNDKKIREQCEARFFYECDMASMRAEGRAEGRTEGQTEIIGQFYHNGFSAEKIAEITGKQTEEVYAIIRRYDGVVVEWVCHIVWKLIINEKTIVQDRPGRCISSAC